MNILALIKTDSINDIPAALRALATVVEHDLKIQGEDATSMGPFWQEDGINGCFNYVVSDTQIDGICEYVSTVLSNSE